MSGGNPLIRLLPFQLIESATGVVIRRGALRIALEGDGIAEVVAKLQEAATDDFCSRHELLSLFPPVHRDRVDAILHQLAVRRLAELRGQTGPLPGPRPAESQEDVFFWQLGTTRSDSRKATGMAVALIGINRLSVALRDRLQAYGRWDVTLVDDVPLRNHELLDSDARPRSACAATADGERIVASSSIVVACAEFGGLGLLKPWNALALQHGKPFLPVLIQDLSLRLGPLTIPDQTACLACLEARQNSHLQSRPAEPHLVEAFLGEDQSLAATHPAIVDTAAPLAAFELLRFSAGIVPRRVGKLIELNLMGSGMVASRVLRAPRCPVCSPLRHAGKLSLEKVTLNPERWAEVEARGSGNGRH